MARPSTRKPGETRGRRPADKPDTDPALFETCLTLRQRIEKEADPIGHLIRVMNGDRFETTDAEGNVTFETPSLAQRTDIALKLTGKILPDLKSLELTGDGDGGGGEVALGNADAVAQIVGLLGRGPISGGTATITVEPHRPAIEGAGVRLALLGASEPAPA